ncbi:MAG: NACHT domain-containing protein, partial [Deltaproteobacteria bacterium]|nr:NACHT domain-containing protein [Deltaproteobacteria bacterium]
MERIGPLRRKTHDLLRNLQQLRAQAAALASDNPSAAALLGPDLAARGHDLVTELGSHRVDKLALALPPSWFSALEEECQLADEGHSLAETMRGLQRLTAAMHHVLTHIPDGPSLGAAQVRELENVLLAAADLPQKKSLQHKGHIAELERKARALRDGLATVAPLKMPALVCELLLEGTAIPATQHSSLCAIASQLSPFAPAVVPVIEPQSGETLCVLLHVSVVPGGSGRFLPANRCADSTPQALHAAMRALSHSGYLSFEWQHFDYLWQATPPDSHLHGPSFGLGFALAAASCLLGRELPGECAFTGQVSVDGTISGDAHSTQKKLLGMPAGVNKMMGPSDALPENYQGMVEPLSVSSLDDALSTTLGRSSDVHAARLAAFVERAQRLEPSYSPTAPAPFGGRDHLLTQLVQLPERPERPLVLLGDSGMGKTSLLGHFVRQVAPEHNLVAVRYSLEQGVRGVHDRLAAACQADPLLGGVSQKLPALLAGVADLALRSGQRLLLLLDDLDLAPDPQRCLWQILELR